MKFQYAMVALSALFAFVQVSTAQLAAVTNTIPVDATAPVTAAVSDINV